MDSILVSNDSIQAPSVKLLFTSVVLIITLFKRHVTMGSDMILHRVIMTESTVYINTFVF